MENVKETMESYSSWDENVIMEKEKMGLAQALIILHQLLGRVYLGENVEEAFQVVFKFIDEMAILLEKIEGIYESKVTQAGVAAAGCVDQDDRSDT